MSVIIDLETALRTVDVLKKAKESFLEENAKKIVALQQEIASLQALQTNNHFDQDIALLETRIEAAQVEHNNQI